MVKQKVQEFENESEELYKMHLNMADGENREDSNTDHKAKLYQTLLINIVSKNHFYGLEIFHADIHSKDFKLVYDLVKHRLNRHVIKEGLTLAVSLKGLHLVDKLR